MAENPIPVCAAADLPPGSVMSFEVGDERRRRLQYRRHLLRDRGALHSRHGRSRRRHPGGRRDRCSLHFGAFNVQTGKAVQAPCFIDLKTFRTEVKDGQVSSIWRRRRQRLRDRASSLTAIPSRSEPLCERTAPQPI